jgi:hypothetical protein
MDALRRLVAGGSGRSFECQDTAADVLATFDEVVAEAQQEHGSDPRASGPGVVVDGAIRGSATAVPEPGLHPAANERARSAAKERARSAAVPATDVGGCWPSTVALRATAEAVIGLGAQGVLTLPHVDSLCDGLAELSGTSFVCPSCHVSQGTFRPCISR